jgi:uncharacterized protein YggT (Ycf19 family)
MHEMNIPDPNSLTQPYHDDYVTQKYQQEDYADYADYAQPTQSYPVAQQYTASIPSYQPSRTWWQRFVMSLEHFFAAALRKLDQLLRFAEWMLLLLLTIQFLLVFFNLSSSIFSQWVSYLSTPLLYPFTRFLPAYSFQGYKIDGSTLAAIVAYIILAELVRRFLKVLFSRP